MNYFAIKLAKNPEQLVHFRELVNYLKMMRKDLSNIYHQHI